MSQEPNESAGVSAPAPLSSSLKRRDTSEAAAFWDFVERTAAEWREQEPDWSRRNRGLSEQAAAPASVPPPHCDKCGEPHGGEVCPYSASVPPEGIAAEEIRLTRERVERCIREAVDRMAKYRGGSMIDVSDFLDDALQYALDDAVAADPVLKAEDALLQERAALSSQLEAAQKERDRYRTLAGIGTWHKDCRPNREQAAREIQKSQAVIDKLADEISTLNEQLSALQKERDEALARAEQAEAKVPK